ncbi:MAG TPA: MFS transporter [Nocardioidaceae bacterium]|nr:MFS transporter [Nocardioidaceae bacterium]
MTTWRHLVHLLRGRWFRRLFAVRVTSQFADGVFQVALASYVIFSPQQAPSPAGIAAALAVVLLPFSILGPFVGVFLDRWSRRQVLVVSNAIRVVLVGVIAGGVAADLGGPLLFVLILSALSVNRFLLAGLSASLPHVVDPPDLIMANAVTPTSGTLASLLGVAAGTTGRVLFEGTAIDGDVVVLVTAAVIYGAAALLALRIPRPLLGPAYDPTRPAVREAARHVARGLIDGLMHLGHRRTAAHGLATIGAHRFFFGISTVMLILLHRNYFNAPDQTDAAFNGLAVAILVSGAGFISAAFITPFVTERVTLRVWIITLLVAAAVTQLMPGLFFTEVALLVSAYFLGVASQGIKICVDTLVQAGVDDAYRGRIFSLYDVIFNVAFVAAAAVAAAVLPDNGRSPAMLVVIALGYVATALLYARASKRHARR